MGKKKYEKLLERIDLEVGELTVKILSCPLLDIKDLMRLNLLMKTGVKTAKMEDIMCHYWDTGRLSGHPHEDGHYEHYGHKEKAPAPGTMPR